MASHKCESRPWTQSQSHLSYCKSTAACQLWPACCLISKKNKTRKKMQKFIHQGVARHLLLIDHTT